MGVTHAQQEGDPSVIGTLPSQRQSQSRQLNANSHTSPFSLAQQTAKKTKKSITNELSQEDMIRNILSQLYVTGVVEGRNGKRILLSDMILEEGTLMPPLIPKQNEQLIVRAITNEFMDLEWIETYRNRKPRKFRVPIDLNPRVRAALGGRREGVAAEFDVIRAPVEVPGTRAVRSNDEDAN